MGTYKVLRSFLVDMVHCRVNQYIEADDEWAVHRLGADMEEGQDGKYVKKVPPKSIPQDAAVLKVSPIGWTSPKAAEAEAEAESGGPVVRTKPARATETKPVTP